MKTHCSNYGAQEACGLSTHSKHKVTPTEDANLKCLSSLIMCNLYVFVCVSPFCFEWFIDGLHAKNNTKTDVSIILTAV